MKQMKKLMDVLSGWQMTIVGGVFLVLSFVLSQYNVNLPFDPAWITVVISGLPLLYLAVWRIIHNPGVSKISSALLITIAILDSQLEAAALRSDQVLLSITQELQSELVFALRSYNGIYSTGADVDGSILPTVRQHLNTATALNNILTNGFGGAYSVFTQDLYNRLEHFYSEYELARSANRSTDTAMELLDSCMRDIENIVLTRFEADGRVIL